MDLMSGTALAIASFIAAIFTGLVKDEVSAFLPMLAGRLLDKALARLPQHARERYSEEWRADLDERPGKLNKVSAALQFVIAARTLALSTDLPVPAGGPTQAEIAAMRTLAGVSAVKVHELIDGMRSWGLDDFEIYPANIKVLVLLGNKLGLAHDGMMMALDEGNHTMASVMFKNACSTLDELEPEIHAAAKEMTEIGQDLRELMKKLS